MDKEFYEKAFQRKLDLLQEKLDQMVAAEDLTELSLLYSFISSDLASLFEDMVYMVNLK